MSEREIYIDTGFGLVEAFSARKGDVVSFVGAGGKTTALFSLSLELRRRGLSVVVTSTTHMQVPIVSDMTTPPLVLTSEQDNWLLTVKANLARYGSVTVLEKRIRDDKLSGIEPVTVDPLRSLADCVLIEADGARGRSLKAPAEHEPVVAEETTLTVVVAGIDAIGLRLDEKNVHRLEVVTELSWTTRGMVITEEVMADALAGGYLPKVPGTSRCLCFINKVDDDRLKQAERVGELLVDRGFPKVVFGQARRPHELFYCMSTDSSE